MNDAALVFIAQFCMIFMHGLQSQNVIGGHYGAAFATSLCLGVGGFYVTGAIAAARGDAFGLVWFAYIFAGPLAIIFSMHVFRRWRHGKRLPEIENEPKISEPTGRANALPALATTQP